MRTVEAELRRFELRTRVCEAGREEPFNQLSVRNFRNVRHLTCRVSSARKERDEMRLVRLSQASVGDELLDPVRAAVMKRNWDVNDVSEMRSGGVSWTTSAISSESEALDIDNPSTVRYLQGPS